MDFDTIERIASIISIAAATFIGAQYGRWAERNGR